MKKLYFALFVAALGIVFLSHPSPALAACKSSQTQITIISRDADGVLLPDFNFIVYQQKTNPDNQPYLGSSLSSGKTDAGGQAIVCVNSSSSPYAVKYYQYNSTYGYIIKWQNELSEELGGYKAEFNLGYLRAVFRDAEGELLKDVAFDIYVQEYDVDGKPIIGEKKLNQDKLVSNQYNTGAAGVARAYLGTGTYVLRIHGTGNTYFYLWNQQVYNAAVKPLEYKLGTLRVILTDALAGLLKNRTFSVYQQAYDAYNQPIFGDLIAGNLDVGEAGKKDVYLPTGSYALKIPGSRSDTYYSVWRVGSVNEILTKFIYRLSTMRVILHDANGELLKNTNFSIGEQSTDANGKPYVKKTVYSGNSGEAGYADIYLTPKRYALTVNAQKQYFLDVFSNQITIMDWPRSFSVRPMGEAALTNPLANSTLTFAFFPAAKVSGLASYKQAVSWPYKVQAAAVAKPYTIQFFYNAKALQSRGINPSKLRIAFYSEKTKKWQYVGRNVVSQQTAVVSMKEVGNFVLVELK